MDKLTKEQRRKNMQSVKSKDSKIEILLRKALWDQGFRYRKNYDKLPGKPDIVLPKYKIAIFCDSEFWHGFDWDNKKNEIKSNREFWVKKIESNIKRDEYVTKTLEDMGWVAIRFWGKEITKDINSCVGVIEEAVKSRSGQKQ